MKFLQNRPKWFAPVAIAVAVVLVIVVSVAAKHGPDPVAVTTLAVTRSTILNKLPENGTLSLPQTATIAAQTSANIVRVVAHEGAHVREGDLLMKLDDRAAAAKVDADQASLVQAQSALKKAQATLETAGDANVQNVAQAQENLLAAQSQLQSDVNAKREGQVSAAGFSSLGLSGESQLAEQESAVEQAATNLRTAKEQYEGDQQLFKIDAIAEQQMDRDLAAYQQAQSSYTAAEREYELTKQQLHDSAGQLDAKIEADRHAVDSARAALASAQIEAEQNTAAIDERGQEASVASADAQLEYDQQQLDDTDVRAPFDGVVQTIGTTTSPLGGTADLAVGDLVTQGETLFTIAGNGPMVVKAQVDEQDVIGVKIGQHAFISGEDFPGYSLVGTVIRIAPVVVAESEAGNSAKDVETTIALTRTYSFLRDGMSCDVDIVTGKAEHALVIPQAAVDDEGDKHYVFVVVQRKVKKTQVVEGLKNDTDVAIVSGLKPGDVVATSNISSLKDGYPVNPTPATSPTPSAT
ncbi:MAG TPA: efflux RND transporter periplasmic adaptor subunit [Candidatus Eremiobacteraceae bacterium]|nr:efflux RND transporter periplasmic adaptor subunit [Candidatus Eremiobacteraceae bacterium]